MCRRVLYDNVCAVCSMLCARARGHVTWEDMLSCLTSFSTMYCDLLLSCSEEQQHSACCAVCVLDNSKVVCTLVFYGLGINLRLYAPGRAEEHELLPWAWGGLCPLQVATGRIK